MADEKQFDTSAAMNRQKSFVADAQKARDGLNTDVINYYFERTPKDESDEKTNRDAIRKYVLVARDRLNDLLDRLR